MRKDGHLTRASATEVKQMLQNGGDRTDWQAARALSQHEVERLADEEDGALAEDWESSVVIGLPPRKQAVHIRLDVDILDWFREQGPGYQTRINAVLRTFVDSRRKAAAKSGG
jgi:uncharacterized protein (DUF4415 family)